MQRTLRIGVIGDFKPGNATHRATNLSLEHAAEMVSRPVESCWLPTQALEGEDRTKVLDSFDGFWVAPGSPYASMAGALQAIRWIREHDLPCLGT